MEKKAIFYGAALLTACLLMPATAGAQKKEIIQLQTNVAVLQEQVRELQRSLTERTAVLKTLVEQAVDAVNRMSTTVGNLERAFREAQANTHARVDSLTIQVQALRDSLDEMGIRVAKLSEQLAETENVLQSMEMKLTPAPPAPEAATPAPTSQPAAPPAPPPPPPVPSAETLYAAALRDFTGGKYDLAQQQFADYLKHYSETPLAGNAQYYIGEAHYQQKDYRQAIAEYDRVLTNYSKSYKIAAAQLKKGYALIRLDEREAGIRTLRGVMRDHPNSDEAKLALAELRRLGVPASGGP